MIEEGRDAPAVGPPATSSAAPDLSLTLLLGVLVAIGFAIAAQAALGWAGALAVATPIVAGGGLAAALMAAWWSAGTRIAVARGGWTLADATAGAALAVALLSRAWEGLHRSRFTYDVLSYHLHLPAAWRAANRLTIVATPFGDQAPAYAPSNAELVYEWLLALTGNVRLAHGGQAPFAALACLALFATGRTLGASRAVASGAALLFLLVPELWSQATGAMTDLAMTSFFLAALPFLLRWRVAGAPAWVDVVGLSLSLGLLLGTKYAGALMASPLGGAALVALVSWWRRGTERGGPPPPLALIVGAGLIVATGGFWYLRNAVATADPTFPVSLSLGPVTLARGLFDGAAMRAWTYHLAVSDLKALLEIFEETGWGFLLAASVATAVLLARRRAPWPILGATMVALGWIVIPYQQSRFFFPAWGIAAVTVALAAEQGLPPGWRTRALAMPILFEAVQFPSGPRLTVALIWIAGALLPARLARRRLDVAGAWRFEARRRALGAVGAIAGAVTALVIWARMAPGGQPYVVGDHHDEAWAFVRERLHGRRIAYAGSNLPLPLWGWRLENTVRYVNIGGAPGDRTHDFARRAARAPEPGRGTPSAEPAPERALPDRTAWLANLTAAAIDTMFVSVLYPEVQPSMAHDADGFPVERAWADAQPERFHLRLAVPGVRIYDVGRTQSPAVDP